MSTVSGASSMTMGSLYALMGLAMPPGASGSGAVSPALAMLSAANASATLQISTLLAGMGVSSAGTGGSSLTAALLSLSNLDPAAELRRLGAAVSSDTASLSKPAG
jgi:hypothetical protein